MPPQRGQLSAPVRAANRLRTMQDALIEARVIRAGKSLAFGEIDIRGADDGKSVSRFTTTYALL